MNLVVEAIQKGAFILEIEQFKLNYYYALQSQCEVMIEACESNGTWSGSAHCIR